jgi:hypothetical protein
MRHHADEDLAFPSHRFSTAAPQLPPRPAAFTALCSFVLLDVYPYTPASPSLATPCIHRHPRRLVTRIGERGRLGQGPDLRSAIALRDRPHSATRSR